MIDTIYFDNWNTLVQAPNLMRKGSSTKIFHKYLKEQSIEISYDSLIETYIPVARAQNMECELDGYREPDYRKRLETVFKKLGVDSAVDHSYGAWKYYLRMWPEQTEFFPGVPRMLEELKPRYKLGVITNYMDGPTCRAVFQKLSYDEFFDSMVVSHELGYMKPAEIVFETALRETDSTPERCLMVGDTYDADVVGGNRIGMKTVLVDIYDNQHEFYHDCSMVIKNIDEFPDTLQKLASG